MRKYILIILSALISLMFLNGCSSDGVVVAKYVYNQKETDIKIGDIKNEVMQYVNYNPGLTNDLNWHKDFIFDKISYDLIYFEQLKNGLVNKPEYRSSFDSQYKKQYLLTIFQKTQTILNKKMTDAQYPIVKVSHILLMVNKETNINGKPQNLSDADLKKLISEKENLALNIIETLKTSKNLSTEFSNTAARISEDAGSKIKGGSVGYFTKGMMVKEFEEAAFAAKNRGLIEKPVKTDYGIHILYVSEPLQKKTLKEIQNLVGKDFQYMQRFFQNSFFDAIKNDSVKEYYKVNLSNNTITVDGGNITLAQLKDDTKMIDVFGKPYNWKESKDVIMSFIPTFMSNLNITNFETQMANLKEFIPFVEYGIKLGVAKSSDFEKDMSKFKDQLNKKIAFQVFMDSLKVKIKDKVTPQIIRGFYDSLKDLNTYNKFIKEKLDITIPPEYLTNYYESVKSSMSKEEKVGIKTLLSFKELEQKINDEIERSLIQQAFEDWRQVAKSTYKVAYMTSGVKDLVNYEIQQIKENQKIKEKNARKQKQQPQSQQQPNR